MTAPTRTTRSRTSLAPEPASPAGPRVPRRVLIVIATVVAVSLLGWLVLFSPVLGAQHVVVHGTSRLSVAQVRDAARVPSGRPLLRLDAGAIQKRVTALPEVATARVRSDYPSTVVITITERVAVGYVLRDGTIELVDRTGTQFRRASALPPGLPQFDLPSGADGVPAGQAVATVAASLPPTVLSQLLTVRATSPSDVTLVLRDQRTVRWGSAQRSADKARLLPVLLGRPGKVFDVSDPDEVFAR